MEQNKSVTAAQRDFIRRNPTIGYGDKPRTIRVQTEDTWSDLAPPRRIVMKVFPHPGRKVA